MKYHIVVNTTKFEEKYSYKTINDIFIKVMQIIDLNSDETILYSKCRCYTIILLLNTNNKTSFFGKSFVVKSQNDVDKILDSNFHNFSLQTLDEIHSDNNYIIPRVVDGLGNRLFQLLCAFNHANKNNKKICLNPLYMVDNQHSKINYYDTLFNKFVIQKCTIHAKFSEANPFLYAKPPIYDCNVLHIGYFQNEKYLTDICHNFFDIINLEQNDILKESIYIHLRLGDYFAPQFSAFFNIGLLNNTCRYYSNALNKYNINVINNIYIMSNDLEKAKPLTEQICSKYNKINIIYVDKNEIESLNIMSRCEFGGIGSNSSFSWWGAYLNNLFNDQPNKIFTFPNKWTNMHNKTTCDVYFNGSTIVEY